MEIALKDVALAMLGNLGIIGEVMVNHVDRPKYGNYLYGAYGNEFDTADGRRVMVVGLTRLMQAALPMLARAPGGRFVAVSSFVAHRFNLPGAVYPATASAKAAVEALVKAAAREVAATGTTVNAVAPGFVRKDKHVEAGLVPAYWQQVAAITPIGRIALPDEIAGVIAFLLGPDAGFITGQTLHVDGGLTL